MLMVAMFVVAVWHNGDASQKKWTSKNFAFIPRFASQVTWAFTVIALSLDKEGPQ
jgi:hypothetical protein